MSAQRTALRTMAHDFGWLSAGQLGIKLIAFAFGVWVVRALGPAEFGRFSAALAFAGLFGVATGPGAATFGTREMATDPAAAGRILSDIAGLRATLGLFVVPLLPLVTWFLGRPDETLPTVTLAGLSLPLYAVVGTLDSALAAQRRVALASSCAALRQVLFAVFGGAALLMGGGALALLVAANLSLVARVLVTWTVLKRELPVRLERPDPGRWPAMARRMLPFSVEGMAELAGLHVPMVVLSLVASDAVTGHYGAAFSLILVALPFAQGVGTVLAPRLSTPAGRGLVPGAVGAALRLTLALAVPVATALTLGAGVVMGALFGETFVAGASALRILVWALPAMFAWEALRAGLMAMRLEARAARSGLVSFALAVIVAAVLAPIWGATGAALAFLTLRLASVGQFAAALSRALPADEARQTLGLPRRGDRA